MLLVALFRLAFASASDLQPLTSQHNATRRSVLQKVQGRTLIVLPLLVNTGFQVLFHSPPGVLFTFPSRYYALSVTISYLGLEGGPPCFPPDSSCPAVLWYRLAGSAFRVRVFHPLRRRFPTRFHYASPCFMPALNPGGHARRFGLFPFRSPLLRKSMFLSFPPGTEMFQFPGCPSPGLFYSSRDDRTLLRSGSPIRISTNQCLLAAPRSFSQLATSFFGVWCPGIHPVLFLA